MRHLVHSLFIVSLMLPFFHRHEASTACHHQHADTEESVVSNEATLQRGEIKCDICLGMFLSKKHVQDHLNHADFLYSFVNGSIYRSQHTTSTLYFMGGNRAPPQIV